MIGGPYQLLLALLIVIGQVSAAPTASLVLDAEIQGKWNLLRIRQGKMLTVFNGATANINFKNTGDNVGNVGGNSGCNRYSSQYTVTNVGKIEFGLFASTLIACQEPKSTLEGLFGSALDKVNSFDVVNGILRLKQGLTVLMTFTKDIAVPPECVCTADFNPVCCDGQQYGNQCTADCSGAINCTPGKCPGLTCAPGSAIAKCPADTCVSAQCEAKPEAGCIINPCGEPLFDGEPVDIEICDPVFVLGDKIVDCELDAEIQGKWNLLRIRQGKMLTKFFGATANINFKNTGDNVGNVGGKNGCNFFSSKYTVTQVGKIDFGSFVTTKIACQKPQATLEGLFGSALDKVNSFDVVNGILRLKQGLTVLMTFAKDVADVK